VRVKDINPGSGGFVTGDTTGFAVSGGVVFFQADDGVHGCELWRSDGTLEGTTLVKDLDPGPGSPFSKYLAQPVPVGGLVFFHAEDPLHGIELWRSDGTDAGTVRVKDINPGAFSSLPDSLANCGGALYFRATDGVHGTELWKSDGTEAGTSLVADIAVVGGDSSPEEMVVLGGIRYFVADDGTGAGRELWRTDGTAGGTSMVKDLNPTGGSDPTGLTVVGGVLFFSADDGSRGRELWMSDGTAGGTTLVKDINSFGGSNPASLTLAGATLYFLAEDDTHGPELWKSDGTEPGTVLVKDINSGPGPIFPYSLDSFPIVPLRGVILFPADDGFRGLELWKSNGTAEGTTLVKEIDSGPGDGFLYSISNAFTMAGTTLYFAGKDAGGGIELWRSDGTEAGTTRVKDIAPGPAGSDPGLFTAIGDTLCFRADDGSRGLELWKSDGTAEGTTLVKDVCQGPGDGLPDWSNEAAVAGGVLYFQADDGVNGQELWKSDGTKAGTVLVKDINPAGNTMLYDLTAAGATLYFLVDDGLGGRLLFASDGTGAGTTGLWPGGEFKPFGILGP